MDTQASCALRRVSGESELDASGATALAVEEDNEAVEEEEEKEGDDEVEVAFFDAAVRIREAVAGLANPAAADFLPCVGSLLGPCDLRDDVASLAVALALVDVLNDTGTFLLVNTGTRDGAGGLAAASLSTITSAQYGEASRC